MVEIIGSIDKTCYCADEDPDGQVEIKVVNLQRAVIEQEGKDDEDGE